MEENSFFEIPKDENVYIYEIYVKYPSGSCHYGFRIDSQDEWATSFITEEEYKKRINKYEQVGSQAFYELNLYNIFHINQTFVTYEEEIIQKCGSIFFSMDGKAFIKPKLSKELSKITDNQIVEILSQKAVELKQKVYKK